MWGWDKRARGFSEGKQSLPMKIEQSPMRSGLL